MKHAQLLNNYFIVQKGITASDIKLINEYVLLAQQYFNNYPTFVQRLLNNCNESDLIRFTHYTAPSHVGGLVISSHPSYIQILLKEHGFSVSEIFASTIVKKNLENRYSGKKIAVDIIKARNQFNHSVELFTVTCGLSRSQTIREIPNIFHYAVTVSKHFLNKFESILTYNNYVLESCGKNMVEQSITKYYVKNASPYPVRMELFKTAE